MQHWTIHSYQLSFQFSEWIPNSKGNSHLEYHGICVVALEVLEDGQVNRLFPLHFHQISWIQQMKLYQNKNKPIPIKLEVEQPSTTPTTSSSTSSNKKNKKKEEEKKQEQAQSQTFAIATANQEMLSRGKYFLEFHFQNQLRESHHNGIYYVNSLNSNNLFVLTHFEPNFARTAFPCVDEVEHKATFILQLQFPLNWIQNSSNAQQIQT